MQKKNKNQRKKENNLERKRRRTFLSYRHWGYFQSKADGTFDALKITIKMDEGGVFKETEEKVPLKMEKGEKFLTWIATSFTRGKVGFPMGYFYVHKKDDEGVEYRVSKKDFLTVRKNSLPTAEFPC